MDTLVLGCTHYVFAQDILRDLLGPDVALIATGEPVARQTRRLLQAANALACQEAPLGADAVTLFTTGDLEPLQNAVGRWLQLPARCCSTVDL